jgi:hypothetical protein
MPFYDSPAFGGSEGVEIINGVKFYRARREPCPVCGHPTGDCTGESESPKTIFGFGTNTSLDNSVMFFLEEDYIETRQIVPGVTTDVIVHHKGTAIPISRAKELGLLK